MYTIPHSDSLIYEWHGRGKNGYRYYYAIGKVSENYKKFLDNLQFNFKIPYDKKKFNNIYSALKAKDELEANKLDIIGVVVYGNQEELERLKSNPHIKASSVGVITKDIVFK